MVKIFGQRVHGDRLKRLHDPRIRRRVGAVIEQGGQLIAADAKESIIDGSISGPGHIPSLPGEPPNADTHELDESIVAKYNPATLTSGVTATAEHAVPMEMGTSTVAERPYLRPAGQRQRPGIRRRVADVLNSANRGA